ncbi:hypothetical protein PYCCODRAFT_1439226 [Trametes coccinea BRFM310]|uniref:Uncharacterized protein n=1 Tax=Trametes coccinea (strain BRFM310) TaxID=1353009 RepID=A0A1Y2IBQ0_TRAC3|nr:hypothetical protein PYCCODRAFT_1439226 [Trametes coccinea BRFM310]
MARREERLSRFLWCWRSDSHLCQGTIFQRQSVAQTHHGDVDIHLSFGAFDHICSVEGDSWHTSAHCSKFITVTISKRTDDLTTGHTLCRNCTIVVACQG